MENDTGVFLDAVPMCIFAAPPLWFKKPNGGICTRAVGHRVKVAVGEHEVLGATFGLQLHCDVSDAVVETCEPSEKVDGERSGGTLHVHSDPVRPRRRPHSDVLDLLQQVAHRQDLVLPAADGPRADAGDLFQVSSKNERGTGEEKTEVRFSTAQPAGMVADTPQCVFVTQTTSGKPSPLNSVRYCALQNKKHSRRCERISSLNELNS